MTASEFKSALKQIQNNLRGLTIQFRQPNSVTPFTSLKEFDNAVLSTEATCNSYSINQVWTTDGVKVVSSVKELVKLFKVSQIEAVSFSACYRATSLAESIRMGGPLD